MQSATLACTKSPCCESMVDSPARPLLIAVARAPSCSAHASNTRAASAQRRGRIEVVARLAYGELWHWRVPWKEAALAPGVSLIQADAPHAQSRTAHRGQQRRVQVRWLKSRTDRGTCASRSPRSGASRLEIRRAFSPWWSRERASMRETTPTRERRRCGYSPAAVTGRQQTKSTCMCSCGAAAMRSWRAMLLSPSLATARTTRTSRTTPL